MVETSPWLHERGEGPQVNELEFPHQTGANLGLSMGGCVNTNTGDMENVDSNRMVREEDCPIEIGNEKKRQRSSQFSSVSNDMDLGKTTGGHPYVHEYDISTGSTRQDNQMQ
ncbi:hypothetical protein GOBAR_AA07989 [Gossypium barbadense]|uniref:Uncharacterized protein n=1 Tax=Gossypium barbadense TaxID=3634 RepID=A0A2P5YAM0_GOSBA|nr:hypothetical protein GOBAR_AA07989 [Gossypium barbadense]